MADPPWDAAVRRIRRQAAACAELGSPFYARLLARVADDVAAGGPVREVLRGHEDDPGDAVVSLRLMGGVHRLVLEGRAPELARHYPSVGGTGDAEAAWPDLRDVLAAHRDELRDRLDQAPQTNEVGRSAVLVGGLLLLAAVDPRPVRLVEIGASGGLNLRADRYRVELADGGAVGPAGSAVVLRDPWAGRVPPLRPSVTVVERLGCDVAPVDTTTEDGRLTLMSYVWPDQGARLERLRGALQVAVEVPAEVQTSGAGDFLDRTDLADGVTTVVWHSVMWQYLGAAERSRIDARLAELGARTSDRRGLVRLALEPRLVDPSDPAFRVVLQTWPGGAKQVLGTTHPHGIPTTWE